MALHDAPEAASYGFRLFALPVEVASGSDRLGTIDPPRLFQCRAIVPNGSTRRASGGVLRFSAVCLTGRGGFRFRSIGDNRSTMPPADFSKLAIHPQRFLRLGPPEDLPDPLFLLGPLLNPFFGPLGLPRVLCRSSEPIPPLGRPGPLCS